jgi:hypothetical protein
MRAPALVDVVGWLADPEHKREFEVLCALQQEALPRKVAALAAGMTHHEDIKRLLERLKKRNLVREIPERRPEEKNRWLYEVTPFGVDACRGVHEVRKALAFGRADEAEAPSGYEILRVLVPKRVVLKLDLVKQVRGLPLNDAVNKAIDYYLNVELGDDPHMT